MHYELFRILGAQIIFLIVYYKIMRKVYKNKEIEKEINQIVVSIWLSETKILVDGLYSLKGLLYTVAEVINFI